MKAGRGVAALRCAIALLVIAWSFVPSSIRAQVDGKPSDQAQMILKRADEVRFPSEAFEVKVTIRTSDDGQEEVRQYKVLSRGNSASLVMVTEPASDRGQILLMRERDLWLYLPNVSQPVRLSMAQRLTGQVANGDIARANFAGDYSARLLGTEQLNGHEAYHLELIAVDRAVTYQKVLYWVRRDNSWPMKAEFFAASGRLLKTCVYEEFKSLGGQVRPTRLVMRDALRGGEVSVLDYEDLKLRNLPDKVFTKDYLKRLQ
jgi:hypothetical protein